MRGAWNLTEIEKEQYVPFIEDCIKELYRKEDFKPISLTDTSLNPKLMQDIMKELGYTEKSFDTNGWEYDFWITFTKDNAPRDIIVGGTGMTFALEIYLDDTEE